MRAGPAGLLLGAVGAALLACSGEPTAPGAAVTLHLDRYTYVATLIDPSSGYVRYAFRAVVRYQNTTSDTIYLERCGPGYRTPMFSVPIMGGGESGYDVGDACVGSPPLPFPPGALRTDTLSIEGPNAFDHYTHQPYGVITGMFWIVYSTCSDDGIDCSGPGPRVASPLFWVRLF